MFPQCRKTCLLQLYTSYFSQFFCALQTSICRNSSVKYLICIVFKNCINYMMIYCRAKSIKHFFHQEYCKVFAITFQDVASPRFMYPYHISKYGWSETFFWNNHNWVDLLSSCGIMPSLRFLYHKVNMEEVKGKCLLFSWLSYEWIWECGWPRKMFQYFLNIPH